jgi:glycosyltransferase involved in cell wall biosynthesis
MKVAIDGRALLSRSTGIGTYTRGIAEVLAARDGFQIGLFSPRPLPENAPRGSWSVHEDSHPSGLVWAQTVLPRRTRDWGADVLLAALTIGPGYLDSVPFVSVVHDLTAWTHPGWHSLRTVVGFVPLWERTLERAVRLLCVSQTTASELARLYPETGPRVRVACNGVDPAFSPREDETERHRVRGRYSGGQPFILYLGTLEPRKNLVTLVAACERLWARRRSRPDLVLAGGAGWKTAALHRRVARSPWRDKIHLPGYASREIALGLYRAAEAFVYPSWEEGFGLPVAEAMACGVPVVASTAAALREVGDDAVLYAGPDDVAGLAAAIEMALEDGPTRARLRGAGPRRAARFTWEAAGAATAAALEEAAGETG